MCTKWRYVLPEKSRASMLSNGTCCKSIYQTRLLGCVPLLTLMSRYLAQAFTRIRVRRQSSSCTAWHGAVYPDAERGDPRRLNRPWLLQV